LLISVSAVQGTPLIAEVNKVNSLLGKLAVAAQVGVFVILYVSAEAGMFYYVGTVFRG
jgi:hypothetical protein